MGKKQTCFHCKTIFEIFFNVFNVNKLFPGIMIFGAKRSKHQIEWRRQTLTTYLIYVQREKLNSV